MRALKFLSIFILLNFSFAGDKQVTLLLHHFLSPKAPAHTKLIEPWARQVEAMSKGEIKIEILPSMSLGGKPNELYRQVRDQAVDLVWVLAAYAPGVFARTEVFELPTIHRGNSLDTTMAIYENFDLIKDDYKRVKPLLIHAFAGNALHSVNKRIESMNDLKGLKLRSPSRTGAWYIAKWDAQPVGMPLTDIPQSLSKGAIDGMLVPFEVFPPYKFHQLVKFSYEGYDLDRFGTSVAMLLMNKESFNALPKHLKAVIEKSADVSLYKKAGELFMQIEEPGKKMHLGVAGNELIKFDEKMMSEFNKYGDEVVKMWANEITTKRGINGDEIAKNAREAVKAQAIKRMQGDKNASN